MLGNYHGVTKEKRKRNETQSRFIHLWPVRDGLKLSAAQATR